MIIQRFKISSHLVWEGGDWEEAGGGGSSVECSEDEEKSEVGKIP